MAAQAGWKEKLKGAFELVFLFGRGIQPFEKGDTKKTGLQSIWIPVVFFPLSLVSAYLWPPAGIETIPMDRVLITEAIEGIAGFASGALILWLASIALDRRDRFWIAFAAGNWIGIPLSLISTPFLGLALMKWYPREQMDNIFMFILYYGFLAGACVNFRGLKINWELAGFISCLGIVVGQLTQNVLYVWDGVPIR